MKTQQAGSVLVSVLLIAGVCAAVRGESSKDKIYDMSIPRLSAMFSSQVNALGVRVKVKGKEKTTYVGELFDAEGNSSKVKVIHQLPDMVRLEGFKKNESLSFDGEKTYAAGSRDDESLLEVFAFDTAEGMLASVQNSAAVRLLGRGFGADPRLKQELEGPRYDIFDVATPNRCSKDKALGAKLYYFDSKTGLLQSTRYYDRSGKTPVKVETRLSVWGMIDGSAYPARIDHYKGGKLVFSFIAEQIIAEPSTDIESFR